MPDGTADAVTPEVVPDLLPGSAMLDALRDGQVVEEIGDALRELNQLVLLHENKGQLVIKLTVHPQANRMVIITDEIEMKPPKAALPSTLQFVDRVGNLKKHGLDLTDRASSRELDPDTREHRSL